MGRLLLLLIGVAAGVLVALYLVARRDLEQPAHAGFEPPPEATGDVELAAAMAPPETGASG